MIKKSADKTVITEFTHLFRKTLLSCQPRASADPEGGTGGPDPPGKSQVIWVSVGNKQLDPPGKSGPPLENVGPALEP